jgi:serine/threonine-protein kinase
MGIVYEAEHRLLRTRLVVKVLRAEHATDPVMVDRLRIEAQAAATLATNQHIVHVSDLGRLRDGTPYLVMQKLDGSSLRQYGLEHGPLPVVEAVDLARQALVGLAAAHAIGVVHRDIKPANLFLCAPNEQGERVLKILDFGIAKVLDTADPTRAPQPLARPTQEGVALGTPRYLAPEQVMGSRVDGRSDIYSVGAVLYWLLTGRDPFHHHKGAFDIMRAHLLEEPSRPSAFATQPIPAALDAVVLRALAKSPNSRFNTAEEFSASLAQAVESARVPARWAVTERIDCSAFHRGRDGETDHRGPPPAVASRDSTTLTLSGGPHDEPGRQRESAADTLPWPSRTLAAVRNDAPEPQAVAASVGARRSVRRTTLVGAAALVGVVLILLLWRLHFGL